MANEFRHKDIPNDPNGELTQVEYESTTHHQFDSQAAGDILYASSSSQLSRLGRGTRGLGGATITVAASDASAGSLALADYICDGTADDVQIQAAIDACLVSGKVFVSEGTINTVAVIVINKEIEFECLAQILPAAGVNAIQLGNASGQATRARVKLGDLTGTGKATAGNGIEIYNANQCQIGWRNISSFANGINIDASVGKAGNNEGRWFGGQIISCTNGISFSATTVASEGNIFWATIFTCDVGIQQLSGGTSTYNIYHGTSHNIGGIDVNDEVGKAIFLLDFYDPDVANVFQSDSIIISPKRIYFNGNIAGGDTDDDYLDFINSHLKPVIFYDFDRDSTADWTLTGCTLGAPSKSVTRFSSTAADNRLIQTVNFDGGKYPLIIIRYKYISGVGGSNNVYYTTSGHGYSASYIKNIGGFRTDGNWHIKVLDMRDLTTGGTDWIDSTITGLRLSLANEASDVFDIDFISVSGFGMGDSYVAGKINDSGFGIIEHHTAGDTLGKYETGSMHTNLGAGGAILLNLPQDAPAGTRFEFAVMAAQELRIDPGAAGAIYINGAKQTDDKYITADDEAESVILTADGNGDWIASSVVGTWGVEA